MRERTSASIVSSSMFLIASTCLATTGPTSVLRPPTDVYTLLYPDILIDNWKICATIDVGTAKSFLEEGDVSLSSHAMPPRHPAPSREPLHHPERWTTAPKHKKSRNKPNSAARLREWMLAPIAGSIRFLCAILPLRWRSTPDQCPIEPWEAMSQRPFVPPQCSVTH